MTQVLPLGTLACVSAIQTLLQYTDDSSRRTFHLVEKQLQTDRFTAVSEKILQKLRHDYPQKLTNQLLLILAPPSMRQLSVVKCSSVTALGIEKLLKRCRKVEALELVDCNHLMHPLVFKVWGNLTCNMTSVSLESTTATDDIVHVILRSMPQLHHLNLSLCDNITDKAFLLGPTDHNELGSLALTSVDLSGCRNLTNLAVKHLTEACGQSLHSINLSWTKVTFLVLVYLAGYTLPVALLQDEMTSLQLQLAEISVPFTPMPCSTEAPSSSSADIVSPTGMPTSAYVTAPTSAYVTTPTSAFVTTPPVSAGTGLTPFPSDESIPCSSTNVTQYRNVKYSTESCRSPTQCSGDELELSDITVEGVGTYTENTECQAEDSHGKKEFIPAQTKGCNSKNGANENRDLSELNDSDLSELNDRDLSEPNDRDLSELNDRDLSERNDRDLSERNDKDLSKRNDRDLSELNDRDLSELNDRDLRERNDRDPSEPNDRDLSEPNDRDLSERNDRDLSEPNDRDLREWNDRDPSEPNDRDLSEPNDRDLSEPNDRDLSERNDRDLSELNDRDLSEPNDRDLREWNDRDPSEPNDRDLSEPNDRDLSEPNDRDLSEPNDSVAHFHSAASNYVNTTSELVFQVELVPFLTLTHHVNGVTSESQPLTTTWLHLLPNEESMHPLHESSVSDVDSIAMSDECHYDTEVLVEHSFESQLNHIDLRCIAYTTSQTMATLCLKFFFLMTGTRLHNVALSWKSLDDSMLQFIATHTPSLKTVALTDCDRVTKIGVSSLCSHCPCLQHINLQGVVFIGDGALVAPSLQTLSLAETNITDVTLHDVVHTSAAKLKDLDISWCEELTTEGVNAVAENCVNLEKLAVRQGPVTDETLLLLAHHCRRLRVLNLSSITSITDNDLVMLSLRLKELEELDVSWNCSLSDVGVHPILRHCIHLKSLVLSGIKVLTSEPFVHIISELSRWRKCQALLRLKLHERNVLDEQLSSDEEFDAAYVATRSTSYAPSLRWLDLEYCDKINDTHLAEIVAVCRGTLKVRDYYGENVEPAWITCCKGSVFHAKGMW